MVELGWVGLARIFCVIFGLDRFFLVSGQIFQPVPDPSLDRVGSGRFLFDHMIRGGLVSHPSLARLSRYAATLWLY